MNKKVLAITAIVVLLAVAAGVAALLGVFRQKDGKDTTASTDSTSNQAGTLKLSDYKVNISALESDSLGVSPTTEFRLAFDGKAPEENVLASSLSVEPEQAFQLKKVSRGEFSMQFDRPLEKDSIYRFILSDRDTGEKQSWAFQTKKALNVIRSLPRTKAVQVPANSGIEITFSAENLENPENYFEISPQVAGRFEQHGKTLVFVPEKLELSTIYTVTIKRGIGVKGSNDKLENDYTFTFQTEVPSSESQKTYFSFSDSLYNFTPQGVPAIEVYSDERLINKEVPVELYSYEDTDSFLKDLKVLDTTPYWAVTQNTVKTYDTSKMSKAATVNARIISYQKEYWGSTYLLLPSSLPEGCYLVRTTVGDKEYFTQMQINSASVYILATKEKTLAWLNDSTTGKPLAGAEVIPESGASVISGQDGLALLNEPITDSGDYKAYYYLVKPETGLSFVAQVRNNPYEPYSSYYRNSDITNRYWTYIYLDKGIYLPEDTVNLWGIFKSRNGEAGEKEAVLELVRYDYSSSGDENVSVLAQTRAPLTPNGTFTGSLKISNCNPGSYEVRVKVGDQVVMNNYLQVMEYTKPAYKLGITPDRNYMNAWETVNFDIKSSFFEGTPVKGLKLDYSSSVSGYDLGSGTLESNDAGVSRLSIAPQTQEESWRPQSMFLTVSNKEAEEQSVSEYCSVAVFPKDTMIEVDSSVENQKAKVSITTSRIDLGRLKGKSGSWFSEDEYRGSSVNMPLTASLYEKYYVKRQTGEYYDYINKVKRYKYEYDEEQRLVKQYDFSTANGKYEIDFTMDKDRTYFIDVMGKDSEGRAIKETRYIYSWYFYSPDYSGSDYYIAGDNYSQQYSKGENVIVEVLNSTEEGVDSGSSIQTGGAGTTESLSSGTAITAAASSTGNDYANRRYLYVRMKNGVLNTAVSPESKYQFPFEADYIPNMYVKALCFDGRNIYDAGLQEYSYDSQDSRLEIGLKADKEQYKPGDTVKLSFDIKDANGKPCSSELNISVVDEAFFAISPQEVNTLNSLYGPSVASGILFDYLSYHPLAANGDMTAEMGEGGDMYVRKDFRDSALFLSVTSGADGKAEASFQLPDNLTSWRITYQSVTEDLKSGSGKMNIASSLPFFVDTIFNKTFITGDTPSILVRANGTEISSNDNVDYTVVVTDAAGEKSYKCSSSADSLAEVRLEALTSGNHTVRVEAVCGKWKDAVERRFKVSDSLLETSKIDYTSLSDSTVLSNQAKGLTALTFYGEDSSLLYNELQRLYWSWGQRLDQKLAVKVAGDLLQKYFNEEPYRDGEFELQNYQTDDGGLALLTYDSSNPELSAKLCSLAADYIDHGALASYFRKLLGDEKTIPEDAAYAYWGLAALREPVLLDIRSRLQAEDITPEIRLIYGVALSEIGDYQGAREIYDDMMKSKGKVEETYAYIENGSRDQIIASTALGSLIALRINAPEKRKLFDYIKSNSTSELLVNMERLIFVKNHIKDASLDCSFSYELDGSRKQIDLKKGGFYRLTVTAEQLAKIKFSEVKGKIVATSIYVSPASEVNPTADSPFTIERVYSGAGTSGSPSVFGRSGDIRVTITPKFGENAPDGFYEITDILPAGFRYISAPRGEENTDWYPDEVTGQKVVFGYYYNKTRFKNKDIVYFAKAVSPGSYTADNAAIRYFENNQASYTDRMKVQVK